MFCAALVMKPAYGRVVDNVLLWRAAAHISSTWFIVVDQEISN